MSARQQQTDNLTKTRQTTHSQRMSSYGNSSECMHIHRHILYMIVYGNAMSPQHIFELRACRCRFVRVYVFRSDSAGEIIPSHTRIRSQQHTHCHATRSRQTKQNGAAERARSSPPSCPESVGVYRAHCEQFVWVMM